MAQFEVHLPADIARRLREGSAYLGRRHEDDLLTAVVFDAKTKKIIKQVALSEKSPELVSPELLSSLSQASIYSALADVSRRLEVVDRKLDAVLQGQRDDRLGLVDSAENLYYLAALAHDQENRRQLLISAISQSSEGRGRLIREVEYYLQEIEKLPTDTGQILISSFTRDVSKDARHKAKLLETALEGALKASYIMAFSCAELDESSLFREAWLSLDNLIPQINRAKDKAALWLPDDPRSLPDSLSTLVSLASGIVETGKQLEVGTGKAIKINLLPDMLVDGEM
jgi:hypothetical protein